MAKKVITNFAKRLRQRNMVMQAWHPDQVYLRSEFMRNRLINRGPNLLQIKKRIVRASSSKGHKKSIKLVWPIRSYKKYNHLGKVGRFKLTREEKMLVWWRKKRQAAVRLERKNLLDNVISWK